MIGLKIQRFGYYCIQYQKVVILDGATIKSFIYFSDEQMKSTDKNLDTIWTNKTRENAIADVNKVLDESIAEHIKQMCKK